MGALGECTANEFQLLQRCDHQRRWANALHHHDGYDNSSGCTHYDYSASAYVYGPTGNFQQNYPGLSTFLGVPLAPGTYSFSSDGFVNCSCFGSGLSAGGGNGIAEVDSVPSGETTLYNQWADHYATAYAWRASLEGGSFNGRQVREQNGGGDVDTCWFPGSEVPKAVGLTIGAPWSISGNEYGEDLVGWHWDSITHYRGAGRAPCRAETSQTMQINQPSSRWSTYKTNRLKHGIETTTIWSERDGKAASRAW